MNVYEPSGKWACIAFLPSGAVTYLCDRDVISFEGRRVESDKGRGLEASGEVDHDLEKPDTGKRDESFPWVTNALVVVGGETMAEDVLVVLIVLVASLLLLTGTVTVSSAVGFAVAVAEGMADTDTFEWERHVPRRPWRKGIAFAKRTSARRKRTVLRENMMETEAH